MKPRVSTATVALAVAVVAVGMLNVADARPMHAAIVSKYHRYLEEKEAVSTELDAWLKDYGPKGAKKGWIPVAESRSLDDEMEDQRQRFYLTKEQIYEAREANPMAEFGTDGPFTLMTMDEFKTFLSNSHVGGDDEKDTPSPDTPSPTTQTLSENENDTPASNESNIVSNTNVNSNSKGNTDSNSKGNTDSNSNSKNKSDDKEKEKEKKTWAPATEGPLVIAAVRRLRTSGKSQYAFNGGDYSTDSDKSFQSTSDTYTKTSQQTYQSQTTTTDDDGDDTSEGYNFNNVSPGDNSQVGTVSGGSNGGTSTQSWNWWGSNGNNGNTWWSGNTWSWNTGGSAAGSSNSQSTQPSGSSNSQQWTQQPSAGSSNWQWNSQSANSEWNSQSWTQPPSSDSANEVPTTPATQPPAPVDPAPVATEAPAPVDPAPVATEAPAPVDPAPVATEAPVPPTPAPVPATKAPVTAAPIPATAAPAPTAPATKKKSTATETKVTDTKAAGDSDSDSVDWSTSACVNPPGLQGQCGSCWAFATVAALEAAQCIANGDKKAPSYSEQQLVSCDTKDFGCNGGAPVYAMEYVRDNGVCTKSSYPYTSVGGGTAAACANSCTPTKSGITEIVQIPTGDESAFLSAVKQQPVIVSVASDNSAWKQYVSGIITACDTTTVDHAVLAVGYDATTIKIKNSWGTDWGEDGFVRISRSTQNKGTCSVLTDMSYPKL